jgi:predicted PurR-regulated permease PerM
VQRHTTRVALVTGFLLGLLGLGYYLADVLNPFLIALLIAFILNPLVEWLERHGVRRKFAVWVLFGVVLVSVGSLVFVGVFTATDHLNDIRSELMGERVLDPEKNAADKELVEKYIVEQDQRLQKDQGRYYIDEDFNKERKIGLIEAIGTSMAPRLRRIPSAWVDSLKNALEAQAGEAFTVGVNASKGLQVFFSQLWNFLNYLFLVPIYTLLVLLSFTDLKKGAAAYIPGRYRERVLDIAHRLDRTLAAFFRGRLLIAIAKGLLTGFGLWLCGVRFAFFIGVLAGALSVVPLVGVLVGGALAVAFAYQPESWGERCVGVAVVFGAIETIEAVVYPLLIGKNVGLNPLALILSLFCFGRLFGLFGVLLAVPIACFVKIVFGEIILPELRKLTEDDAIEAKP